MPAPFFSALRSIPIALVILCGGAADALAARASQPPGLKIPNSQIEPLNWTDLDGWADDDHAAAFKTFQESCKAIMPGDASIRESRPVFVALRETCRRAMAVTSASGAEARVFFEKNFRPLAMRFEGR